MLTMLSTLMSFLMGGVPKILDFFQDRSDKKHEIELAKMQTEREMMLLQAGYAAQQKIEEIKYDELKTQTASDEKQALIGAQQAEMQALYAHDIALGEGTSEAIKNLRASVRPVLTYCFFALLALIDIGLFIYGWRRDTDFKELADLLWDDETQALFASIIAFHFGGRAFGK